MSTQRASGAAGWRDDPFGRHELRFFDAHRWTPHVRDGERHGLDEPVGPVVDGPSPGRGAGPLTEPVLVVGHRAAGRRLDRAVHAADGRRVGTLRTAAPGARPTTLRALVARDQYKGDPIELVDEGDQVVLTLLRPIGSAKDTLLVRDPEGREAGRVTQQQLRTGGSTYALIGPTSTFLGDVQAEDWDAWDSRVLDARGNVVARIDRDPTDVAPAALSGSDAYVVRLEQPVPEPLRTLVVAAALGLGL